jgi:hypothetical protein
MADGTCSLRITRGSGYADGIRRYRIVVNGQRVGLIGRNSVLDVTHSSGRLQIEARIDWCRSEPLTVDAKPGQNIQVEVSNNWGAALALWGVTFGSRTYLILKRTLTDVREL